MVNNGMKYDEDTLIRDDAEVTDDGQDGKDYKGKCYVISAIFRIGNFKGCLPQILIGPFLNILTYIDVSK